MKFLPLGEVIELAYGKSLPVRARRGGSVPVYGSNGVVGWHDEPSVQEPTVIVGRKGSVGAIHLVAIPSFPIDTTYFVRPRPGIQLDTTYASYALKAVDLSRLRTETGVPGLNRTDAYREPFPLPPLDGQRRIVGILNRAAKIERLRAQAADRLREFIPALFVKMFGDPAENPMGWESKFLGELTDEFRYGTSKKCHDDANDGDTPILRIPNVLDNTVNWNNMKYAFLSDREAKPLLLKDRDILFVRTNGNPDYVGRCAIYCDNRPAAYASYLIRARLKSSCEAIPEYVAKFLTLDWTRQVILRLARTTAGNYNINIENLSRLPILIPPIELQNRFSRIEKKLNQAMTSIEPACLTSTALTVSLMDRLLSDCG